MGRPTRGPACRLQKAMRTRMRCYLAELMALWRSRVLFCVDWKV